ncbi:MAG TPA: xanthine dehydrogenase family protein subunit M [Acidimicrobiia bacterium]|nr:xanthine dehydrogenase family protein subunit M [Acidimicrobiia bacterium]
MKPPPFEYTRPGTIEEALETLHEIGDEGKVLAGGQSLIPLLAFRMARPRHLTDITRISELDHVELRDDGVLSMGALATHRSIETDAELKVRCPAINEAVSQIGHVAIRNRGTVGGSMAHADPAAEWPALALLFDARFHLRSRTGERTVPARDMFVTYMTTALAPDELLVEVEMHLPPPDAGTAFVEVSRRHGDFAMAGAGTVLRVEDGVVSDARMSMMSAGMTAVRGDAAEQMLIGQEPTDELLSRAADAIDSDIDPLEDVHGPAEYKRHLVRVVTLRALRAARARSTGAQR